MARARSWLDAVFVAGGDSEPPPEPQIPAHYLKPPQRQRPASTSHHATLPGIISPSSRKRPALAEIDASNRTLPSKRLQIPNTAWPSPGMSQAPPSPSKKSSRIAAREEKTGGKKNTGESLGDPNVTPRAARVGRKHASGLTTRPVSIPGLHKNNTPEWIPTPNASEGDNMEKEATAPSISSVTESTGSRPRSRSPTKRMIDLKVADKTISTTTAKSPADVPEDVRKLYREIQSLARIPRGVIPLGIENKVQTDAGGDLDDIDVFVATKPNGMSDEELLDEFKALQGIRNATALCKTQHLHEPSWNERVHSRMLEQSVLGRPGISYYNITTARVLKELLPSTQYGETLKHKMIDYAITLSPPLVSEPHLITRLASSPSPLHRTINPSDYSPLRNNPIALSIETKAPNGSTEAGEVQLSLWATAHFNRLRSLTQTPVSITLPLILVSDEHWKLFFACDLENEIRIIDALDFGTTADIIGCYTILKVLRLVVGWIESCFVEWFAERVLVLE